MFQKTSRYFRLPDHTGTDTKGRSVRGKDLRRPPEPEGVLRHTVQDIDRLDHLAQKYYRQPRKWWRICDANPAHPFPLSLLGQDAMATERFPLETSEMDPPVAALLAALRRTDGVEDVAWEESATLAPQVVDEGGVPVEIVSEARTVRLAIRFNRLVADRFALMDAIEAHGFLRIPPVPVGRVGKAISIPRDAAE